MIPVEVPSAARHAEGPEFDRLTAGIIGRAQGPKTPARIVNVTIPGALVPALNRVRGETPAAAFLADALVMGEKDARAEAIAKELETSWPRFRVVDPRPLEAWVRQVTRAQHPHGEVRVIRTLLDADHVRDLVVSVATSAKEATFLVETTDSMPAHRSDIYHGDLSALVFRLCWQHDVLVDVHLAHVALDANELWTYIRLVPRTARFRIGRTPLTPRA